MMISLWRVIGKPDRNIGGFVESLEQSRTGESFLKEEVVECQWQEDFRRQGVGGARRFEEPGSWRSQEAWALRSQRHWGARRHEKKGMFPLKQEFAKRGEKQEKKKIAVKVKIFLKITHAHELVLGVPGCREYWQKAEESEEECKKGAQKKPRNTSFWKARWNEMSWPGAKSGWLLWRRVPGGHLAPRGSQETQSFGKQGETRWVGQGPKVVVCHKHKEKCQEGTWHPRGAKKHKFFVK